MLESKNAVQLAHIFFDALGEGDRQTVSQLVTEKTLLWQNYNNNETLFIERINGLMKAALITDNFRYEDRHYIATKNGAVLQHRLRGQVAEGIFDAPIMVRIYVKNDRIIRFEEYLDQGTLAPLYKAMQA